MHSQMYDSWVIFIKTNISHDIEHKTRKKCDGWTFFDIFATIARKHFKSCWVRKKLQKEIFISQCYYYSQKLLKDSPWDHHWKIVAVKKGFIETIMRNCICASLSHWLFFDYIDKTHV